MNRQFHKLILASSIALAIATAHGSMAGETVSAEVRNARLETQIWTTYALSPYLRAHDIRVSVHEGKATLNGKVDGEVNRDLAKQIALGVTGITAVDNQIVVQTDYVPASAGAERSFGEVIDDATITSAVKSKLLWSRYTDGMVIDVDTLAQRVTLKGTADSAEARELAGRLALNTRNVISVDNRLVVDAGGSPATRPAAVVMSPDATKVDDKRITSKVKSTFMYSSNVDGGDIQVSTSNGIVTLNGKVDSGAERALAIELAQNVRGVKSVNSKGLTI
jgi:osmotically-inducible protein OsmY